MTVIISRDNTDQFESNLKKQLKMALEDIGLTAENYAMRDCPVDTGRLRASITHKVMDDEKAVYIGTNVEYAPYVELGTSTQGAQPFLVPAAKNHINEYHDILEHYLSQ